MFRLRVQSIRSLLWLGNLLVFGGIAMLLAHIWMLKKEGKLDLHLGDEIKKYATGTASVEVTGQQRLLDFSKYSSLWKLNVTGQDPPPEVVAGPEPVAVVREMKPIDTVVRVILSVAGPNFAQIEYVEDTAGGDGGSSTPASGRGIPPSGARGSTAFAGRGGSTPTTPSDLTKRHKPQKAPDLVKLGDPLRAPWDDAPYNGKVIGFSSDGVIFRWGEEDVTLTTPQRPTIAVSARTMPTIGKDGEIVEGRNEPPQLSPERIAELERNRESRQLGPFGWFIGSEERDQIAENYDAMKSEIGVRNHLDEDRVLRLRLENVPVSSLVYRRGLREGDVLRKINGEQILSKDKFVSYIERNQSLTTFQVELERGGEIVTMLYKVAR